MIAILILISLALLGLGVYSAFWFFGEKPRSSKTLLRILAISLVLLLSGGILVQVRGDVRGDIQGESIELVSQRHAYVFMTMLAAGEKEGCYLVVDTQVAPCLELAQEMKDSSKVASGAFSVTQVSRVDEMTLHVSGVRKMASSTPTFDTWGILVNNEGVIVGWNQTSTSLSDKK